MEAETILEKETPNVAVEQYAFVTLHVASFVVPCVFSHLTSASSPAPCQRFSVRKKAATWTRALGFSTLFSCMERDVWHFNDCTVLIQLSH